MNTWQTQVQPGQYPIGAPEKKKGKKWPIVLGIVGGVLFLLIVLVMIGGSDSSKDQPQEDSTEVNLSETDINEEESTETVDTGSDLVQGNRILIGETQNYVGRNGYTDEIEGEFEITLDYVEFADKWEDIFTESPEPDCIFLCAGVTAKNIGKQEGVLQYPTLIYDGEYVFEISHRKGNTDLRYGIPPLSAQTQVYAFQLPSSALESDKSLVLKFSDYDENEKIFFVIREGADGSASMPGNAGAGQEETLEEDYTDYLLWCGEYADGWLDTYLTFELYSDGTQNPECGYITTNFRGNETTGKLYYWGGNEFQWDQEGYSPATYYIYAVENEAGYQLDFYNSDEEYEVTFTKYQ